ncbi:hypothetical protein AMECASPLE_003494 [Ameca splendens]|uniref:Uncharacterized protein n=1 Tax=Ameca splendens TaxID=208324 RepID=A0ABV0ZKG0_9TELE
MAYHQLMLASDGSQSFRGKLTGKTPEILFLSTKTIRSDVALMFGAAPQVSLSRKRQAGRLLERGKTMKERRQFQ